MRALKIAGTVLLGLWMAWITWRIEQVRETAEITCDFATAAAFRAGEMTGAHPRQCPWVIDVFIDNVVPSDPAANSN